VFHDGDTYLPIDPREVADRLERSGFTAVEVRRHDMGGWVAVARVRA
jgi:hypothetical protein